MWAFALLGAALAMLQILVYSVLARQARRSVYLVWLALGAVVGLGALADTFQQLLGVTLSIDAVLLLVLAGVSLWSSGPGGDAAEAAESVSRSVPAVARAN